jgi:hypothetical protein
LLRDVVKAFDPEGKSENLGLRLASARVNWENAFEEDARDKQLEFLAAALRHYQAIIKTTTDSDPYSVKSLAQVSASNAHVRAAFWTPISPSDLVNATDDVALLSKDPLEMTKYDHLRSARDLAQAAELDEERRLPEEALICRGNALEDLAYYCKFTENYPLSVEAFQSASQSAGLRSKAYALLSLGRCQYRWANDTADASLTLAARQKLLRDAYPNLSKAVELTVAEKSYNAAEASLWLAFLLRKAAEEGPGGLTTGEKTKLEQESLANLIKIHKQDKAQQASAAAELALRFQLFERACQLAKQGVQLASSVTPRERMIFWLDSIEIGVRFSSSLDTAVVHLSDVHAGELRVELRDSSQQLFDNALQNAAPGSREVALKALVQHSTILSQVKVVDGTNPALDVLKKAEPQFSGQGDEDKLVELLLQQVRRGAGEPVIDRAERLALSLPAGIVRDRLLGNCFQARAELRHRIYLDYLAQSLAASPANPTAPKLERPSYNLRDIAAEYQRAEQYLALSIGEDIVTNLDKLAGQPLTRVSRNFAQELGSNLERYRFQEFIKSTYSLRHNGALAAQRYLEYNGLDNQLKQQVPLDPAVLPIARMIHDFLKPTAMVRELPFRQNEKSLVENLEKRVRP